VIINSNTSKISFWETIYRNSYQLNDNRQNLLFDRSSSDSNNIKISLIESEKVKELENTKVYFNNHLAKNKVTLKNAMNKIEFNRGLIYENISGANQAFNLMQKFTRTLNNANTDSLYWNVMMNYDTKIIIIDERLAYSQESKNLESDIKLYDSGEMELGEIFEKSGLHFEFGEFENNIKNSNDILKKLDSRYKLEKDKSKLKYILPNQSKYFIYNNIPKISQNIYEKFKFQQKTFPFNLEIDDFKLINSLNDTYNPFLGFLEKENMFYQIDFLTIHIGLIDKIKEKEKSKTTKEIVNSIIKTNKLNPKYVCVHSGRGGLNDENDKINFVPFSILQRCFEDSKFLLSEFFYNNQYLPI